MKHNPKSPFEKSPSECPHKCGECPYFKQDISRIYGGTCTANSCKTLTYDFSRPTDRPLPLPLNCFWWYACNVWNKVSDTKVAEYREERLHLLTAWRLLETFEDMRDRRAFSEHLHRQGGYGLIDFAEYPEAKPIYQEIKRRENGEKI